MREHVRTIAASAAVAAALVLTGCSSDGGGSEDDAGGKRKGGGGAGAEQSSAPAEAGSGEKASVANVAGSWIATTDGKIVALIVQGTDAAVVGEHVCSGQVSAKETVALDLKCGDGKGDGNTDRTSGVVTPEADGKTLTVQWDSGIEDSFAESGAGDKMTDGVPVPTELPGLPTG